MGWKYKTEAERKAAMKAYQANYRALRKSGKWTRKTQIHSARIAAKYKVAPVPVGPVRKVLTPEERKAREAEKNHRYWHDHYSAVCRARRHAAMTPEQLARCERRARTAEARTAEGVVREIVRTLAAERQVTDEAMMGRFLEAGAVDFLLRAIAPHMAKRGYDRDRLMRTAIPATRLFLDRDTAVMGWRCRRRPRHLRKSKTPEDTVRDLP